MQMAVEKVLDNPSAYGLKLSKQEILKKFMDEFVDKKEIESFLSKEKAEEFSKLRSALEMKDYETKK